jgi:hypothetical protein
MCVQDRVFFEEFPTGVGQELTDSGLGKESFLAFDM